jgi:hypothetical protein
VHFRFCFRPKEEWQIALGRTQTGFATVPLDTAPEALSYLSAYFPQGYLHKAERAWGLLFAEDPQRLRFHLEVLPIAPQTILYIAYALQSAIS